MAYSLLGLVQYTIDRRCYHNILPDVAHEVHGDIRDIGGLFHGVSRQIHTRTLSLGGDVWTERWMCHYLLEQGHPCHLTACT